MHKLIIKNGLNLLTIGLFGFCYLSFYHPDLTETVLFSQNFNIKNFYLSCGDECVYFPLIYLFFYLWSFLGKIVFNPNLADPIALEIGLLVEPEFFLFNKLFIVLLFIASVFLVNKIAKKIILDNRGIAAQIYLYSPFSFFAIFIYAGYDVIIVFLCLLAIYFYLKNHVKICFLLLSVSLSFKFFSILFAFSLLAILKEKVLQKVLYFLILASVPLIQFFLFKDDPSFLTSTFALVDRNSTNSNISFNPSILVLCTYFFWILALHFSDRLKNIFQDENFIYLPFVSFLFLFFYTPMQPQWIILILPYIYLLVQKNNLVRQFLYIQLLYLILFLISITNIWAGNIDLNMSDGGWFDFMRDIPYQYKDFFLDLKYNKSLFVIFFGLFYSFLLIPFLFHLKIFKSTTLKSNEKITIKLSFIAGSLILLYPFFMGLFITDDEYGVANEINIAKKIVPKNLRNNIFYDLDTGISLCEVITPMYSNLNYVEFRLDVLNKSNLDNFSFYVDSQEIASADSFNNNKSIFIKLPKSDDVNIDREFCIKNKSNDLKKIFIKKGFQTIAFEHNKVFYNQGSLGLSFLYLKE